MKRNRVSSGFFSPCQFQGNDGSTLTRLPQAFALILSCHPAAEERKPEVTQTEAKTGLDSRLLTPNLVRRILIFLSSLHKDF